VLRFLGFEARLVPSHVGAYRCSGRGCLVDLGHGDGGGLGFGRKQPRARSRRIAPASRTGAGALSRRRHTR
jgi:hypothetical protein